MVFLEKKIRKKKIKIKRPYLYKFIYVGVYLKKETNAAPNNMLGKK
jgi:hypothetical protein